MEEKDDADEEEDVGVEKLDDPDDEEEEAWDEKLEDPEDGDKLDVEGAL